MEELKLQELTDFLQVFTPASPETKEALQDTELPPLQPTRQDLETPVDREPPIPLQASTNQEPVNEVEAVAEVEVELQAKWVPQEPTNLLHTLASTEVEAEPELFPTQEDTEPAE